MTSLLVLIPVSLVMGLVGLCAFFWAIGANQFEDLDGNACRVLNDEDHPKVPPDDEGREHGRSSPSSLKQRTSRKTAEPRR